MKTTTDKTAGETWIEQWMQSVAGDEFTMSQRKVSSLKKKDIDMEDLVREAKKYKIRLLLLKDDKGEELIAASKNEFTILC